jgi:hypothetical protein
MAFSVPSTLGGRSDSHSPGLKVVLEPSLRTSMRSLSICSGSSRCGESMGKTSYLANVHLPPIA